MGSPRTVQKVALGLIDQFYAALPQPRPPAEDLQRCKIVSHRGQHDNRKVLENTIDAFDQAREGNVWGIECDVRWTRDLEPVVFHDPDCRRLFGAANRIADMTLDQVHSEFPHIPTLEALVRRYGRRLHLMIELKSGGRFEPHVQVDKLRRLLAPLRPIADFHILSLEPTMFEVASFVPVQALIPVSTANTRHISDTTLRCGYGGMAGHFAFLREHLLAKHRARGQIVGSGFVSSPNCLFRELNRGIDWIFSNHAVQLQELCDHA
jgi:glycerophosphoryl diester phosphodiesterase